MKHQKKLGLLVGLLLATSAQAQQVVNETPTQWFVELNGVPQSEGGTLKSINAEQATFRSNARKEGIVLRERYVYSNLFNGFSLTLTPIERARLERVAGVKGVFGVDKIPMPQPAASGSPELFTALAMTGADIAQNDLGLDGTGIRVAVMDTGIDIDHPDFGGNGTNGSTAFPTARVVAGYDFVGNAFTGSNTPVPDANPDDCGGHGSHVAGIVGANGVVKGVAPNVSFGAYRVFGCTGSTSADIMIAAMERALADKMQVLNMSIGSSFQWPDYPTAKAATRLVNKGMIVVASIGNSGTSGLFAAGAPGLGDKVIGVASFDNTDVAQKAFSISPDAHLTGFNAAAGAPPPPLSGTTALGRVGTKTTTNAACAGLPAGSLSGQIALIRRGTCSFNVKSANAQAAGAVGVVLYNNVAGALNATVAVGTPITIPVVAINGVEGNLIDDRLALGPVDLTWTTQTVSAPDPHGGLISSFSSYGLSPDLQVKPDIGAPGGNIWSTYPIELGSYASLGGTSMASPHVAGTAALLLQAHPNTPSQAARTILQNTARPKLWTGNPGYGLLDMVHRQGAGMVRIDDAILTTTRIEPSRLALGESAGGPGVRTVTIKNSSDHSVTYGLSAVSTVTTGPTTHVPTFVYEVNAVSFDVGANVVVPAGGSANVTATITVNPALADGGMYGGYLVFTPNDGSPVEQVPYAGYKGDYQARVVLAPTANGFPWLAEDLGGGSFGNRPAGETFTLVGTDIPYIAVHLDHQPRLLRLTAKDAVSGKEWHRVYEEGYLPRNSTSTGIFVFGWDGSTTAGNKTYVVPNGTYTVTLSVLKALGDSSNPAHWETWSSPPVTLARP